MEDIGTIVVDFQEIDNIIVETVDPNETTFVEVDLPFLKGSDGEKGDTVVSVQVGTTTTVEPNIPASVENVGTETEAILNFSIPKGTNGTNGEDGYTPIKGVDYFDGEDGREVEFQKSATHIQWRYVGDADWTNLVALTEIKGEKGDEGDAGRGIVSIIKTDTVGLIDTYTITYTDATTSTFEVTNGEDGSSLQETDPIFTAWDKDYNDLSNKPTIPTQLSQLTDDSTHRLVTDTEKSAWNAKQNAGTYSTDIHPNITALNVVSGTNTGDETTETIKTKLGITTLSGSNTGDQDLSGKQDTLVSGTNIKTINNTSVLGSGNITITGGSGGAITQQAVIKPASGGLIVTADGDAINQTTTLENGKAYLVRFAPQVAFTTTNAGIIRTGSGARGYVVIFDSDSDGRPTTLLANTSEITDTTNLTLSEASLTYSFEAGKQYWVGFASTGTGTIRAHNTVSAVYSVTISGTNVNMARALVSTYTIGNDWNFSTQNTFAVIQQPVIFFRV